MHPAFVFLPDVRLSVSELSAARLDGHLVELGEAYVPADLVEGPELRARTLAPLIPSGAAAAGPTAAWIHGAGDRPPSCHHVRRAVARRFRPAPDRRVRFHDTLLSSTDVQMLGDVLSMTPVRTMVDLALALVRDPGQIDWLRRFAVIRPDLVEPALAHISALRRVPGSRAGAATLERIALRTR